MKHTPANPDKYQPERYESANVNELLQILGERGYINGESEAKAGEPALGESGDFGFGSREYYHDPKGGYNQFGIAKLHATISVISETEYSLVFFGKRN